MQSFGGTVSSAANRSNSSPSTQLHYQQNSSSSAKHQNNANQHYNSSRHNRASPRISSDSASKSKSSTSRLNEGGISSNTHSSVHATTSMSVHTHDLVSSNIDLEKMSTFGQRHASSSTTNDDELAAVLSPVSMNNHIANRKASRADGEQKLIQRQDQPSSSNSVAIPDVSTRPIPIFEEKKYLKFYRNDLTAHRRNWSSDIYTNEARKFADRNVKQTLILNSVDEDIRSVYSLLKAAEMRCMLLNQKANFVHEQILNLETKNPSSI